MATVTEPVAWRVRERPGFDWRIIIASDPDRDRHLDGHEKQPLYTADALAAARAEGKAEGMRGAAALARDQTPEKHAGTLAAHVTGRTIEAAILAAIPASPSTPNQDSQP